MNRATTTTVLLTLALAVPPISAREESGAAPSWTYVRHAEAEGVAAAAKGGVASGDTYSFHHQLGALIDSVFECFSVHMSGMSDNTVTFDGITEFLDPYTNGNQPFVFEFETSSFVEGPSSSLEINTIAGSDLFPEGFEDPKSGTPLDAACVEIGIDDTLDTDPPASVVNASLDFHDDQGSLFGPIDITSAFAGDPWSGRLSIVFPGLTGSSIREVRLMIDTTPSNNIFADGFESGNTASWSSQVP